MLARIIYQIATYEGFEFVNYDDNDDDDDIINRAKATLRRKAGTFPFGSESWRVERGWQ